MHDAEPECSLLASPQEYHPNINSMSLDLFSLHVVKMGEWHFLAVLQNSCAVPLLFGIQHNYTAGKRGMKFVLCLMPHRFLRCLHVILLRELSFAGLFLVLFFLFHLAKQTLMWTNHRISRDRDNENSSRARVMFLFIKILINFTPKRFDGCYCVLVFL